MKMTFTAEAARSMTAEYEKQEELRLIATAEAAIVAEIEPAIKEAAKIGKHQLDISFHYTRECVYKTIRNILIDNGYNAAILLNVYTLAISW